MTEEEKQLFLEYAIEAAAGIAESKSKYRKIVQASIAGWVKDFQNGHIKFNTVDDLRKLIELDLKLQADE
ncbi:hypothetical protein [Aneurinibacillus aneurinilyticus]|uniref:hypothetical protein n=1 Tax=Aneurinibacillus aneurinilyticus TaxID=1391 RepID=UPI0023F227E0|nr:hypothetical protein [Aneurinibacillus aneurinilyticus]